LALDRRLRVIGLDANSSAEDFGGLDFVQADARNPLLAELFKSKDVHTVCHLKFDESARLSEAAFDLNVIDAVKLLSACAEAGVKKVVLKSSMAVYGALPHNSAFLTEDHPLNGSRRYGYTRDFVEIETFCQDLRRQAPRMYLTLLRFPGIIGPACDTPMTRFLKDKTIPTLLGFDPMMQVIHEDDVVGSLVHAVLNDAPGAFNLAAEGVLPLSKLMALAGRFAVPILPVLAYWSAALGGQRLAPIEPDCLRYPWVGDLARMREELGFTPRYTAAEALRQFAEQQRLRPYLPESAAMARDEERLRNTIERRRQISEPVAIRAGEGGTNNDQDAHTSSL
jgi:UDP-glucose 4-epimerase